LSVIAESESSSSRNSLECWHKNYINTSRRQNCGKPSTTDWSPCCYRATLRWWHNRELPPLKRMNFLFQRTLNVSLKRNKLVFDWCFDVRLCCGTATSTYTQKRNSYCNIHYEFCPNGVNPFDRRLLWLFPFSRPQISASIARESSVREWCDIARSISILMTWIWNQSECHCVGNKEVA
jgi:hypothetical protein